MLSNRIINYWRSNRYSVLHCTLDKVDIRGRFDCSNLCFLSVCKILLTKSVISKAFRRGHLLQIIVIMPFSLSSDVNIEVLARGTVGFSGIDQCFKSYLQT